MRPLLEAIGYTVLVRPVAVAEAEIGNAHLRGRAAKSGCCGLKELIKLEGLTMVQYDRVLLLDMDTLVN
eukprot:4673864-Pyramimonas_sp.AAC.1